MEWKSEELTKRVEVTILEDEYVEVEETLDLRH